MSKDPGAHYRKFFPVTITDRDAHNGVVNIEADPYAIALLYDINDGMHFTILKKILRCGKSIKDERQDLLDIISAAERRIREIDR